MEFELLTDLSQGLQSIDFNYEPLKAYLQEQLKTYSGLVVEASPEAIASAKKDRAALNKLEKAISDRRKDIKKKYLEPFELFEAQAKELSGMVEKASLSIDTQVKALEKAEADAKKEQIVKFFNMAAGDLLSFVTFGQFENPKWTNKGYEMPAIEAEISAALNKLRDDVSTVEDLKFEHEAEVLRVLYDTLDLGAALKRKAALELQEKARREQEAARAAAKAALEEQLAAKRNEPLQVVDVVCETPVASEPTVYVAETVEPLQQIDFRVWVTEAQKRALREYFKTNNIKYGRVD